MTPRKGGLGRGLDAMISETAMKSRPTAKKTTPSKESKKTVEEKKEENVLTVKMTEIEPNRKQPRKQFDEDGLLELAESIKQFGVLQPLLVQKKDDYFEIIAGERRWSFQISGIKGSSGYYQRFFRTGSSGNFSY